METSSQPNTTQPTTHSPGRLVSIDIYRGMVMFLMLAEVLHLAKLREVFTGDSWIGRVCEFLKYHTTHVEWVGCSLHDMIQPSFTFLVGTSMAFSIVARSNKGQSFQRMLFHAIGRSLILVFLGIFLRSLGKPSTNFTFDDTLTQIGLGYWILFLISWLSFRGVAISLAVVLLGYWIAFIAYPAPSADFAYSTVGVPVDWPEHWKEGISLGPLTHGG
jgi:heparan-alpha-glucosaminide N-acetyltransferase